MSLSYYESSRGIKLAYIHKSPTKAGENIPAVMFLGGFKSDMEGTKARYLEEQCTNRGQEFLRFDYSGHGQSGGAFVDGTIGAWLQDAVEVMDHVLDGRDVILVGSSMGGWIALRMLLAGAKAIKGVIGIAAAPDFTKDVERAMGQTEHEMMVRLDRLEVPNDYSDEPYIFTRALLEEGAQQCVLGQEYSIQVPLILIQGKQDADVQWEKAVAIKQAFNGPQTNIIFIEDGDHSLSRESDLAIIGREVQALSVL